MSMDVCKMRSLEQNETSPEMALISLLRTLLNKIVNNLTNSNISKLLDLSIISLD